MSCPYSNAKTGACPAAAAAAAAAQKPAAAKKPNLDALRSEIRVALINDKANACPIASRLAWHAAGTFDRADGSGGCDGARIRFEPEASDPANAGLSIIRDLLHPVKMAHPEVSHADLYAIAGAAAIEFLGGPRIPVKFGRTDATLPLRCPVAAGRLPDAAQGAAHLRQVFGRMGFNDQEIVALSGAHTLGRCHAVRSGFDGPWTTQPLRFDNEYFRNLVQRTWRKREWAGNLQFEDVESGGQLMMLPSDLALLDDPKFRVYVDVYARDERAFFTAFAAAYAKLLALGCPASVQPEYVDPVEAADALSAEFRELCMHGSQEKAAGVVAKGANVHALEATSNRSAVHKAAFWGHTALLAYLTQTLRISPDTQDCAGDTALHDAAKFGHVGAVEALLAAKTNLALRNLQGQTALDIAVEHSHDKVAALIRAQLAKL